MESMEMSAGLPVPGSKSKGTLWVVLAVVIVVLGGAGYWYLSNNRPADVAVELPAAAPIESADLGSTVYAQAANPVQGKLPDTVTPVENPLEGAYQNPFE